jgi:hypothetical protein
MLISLHFPKTAGSSFGRSLARHFGARFQRDYGDHPINTPPSLRNLKALKSSVANVFSLLSVKLNAKRHQNITREHGQQPAKG